MREARPRALGRARRRCDRQRLALIITLFVGTLVRRAFLRRLLQQKRRATLRARLADRLVPVDTVARRILRATVEDFAALRLLDDQLAATTPAHARHARRLALHIPALTIVRARDELAEASLSPDQMRAVQRTLLVDRHGRGRDDA